MALSCGEALLRSSLKTSDFVLYVTEASEDNSCKICVHRAVLSAHSVILHDMIHDGEHFFELMLVLDDGYMSAMIEFLQFMYLHDFKRITQNEKVKYLMVKFCMPVHYYSLLSVDSSQTVLSNVCIQLESSDRDIVLARDMVSRIDWMQKRVKSISYNSNVKKNVDSVVDVCGKSRLVSTIVGGKPKQNSSIATRLRSRKKKKVLE